MVPSLKPLFPSVEIARALRSVVCVGPKAAASGFHEPSLVFMTGTDTLLTDGSGAADFLLQGSCRFALVEARTERAFAARADAIGLRYDVGDADRRLQLLAGSRDLDGGVPLRRHRVEADRDDSDRPTDGAPSSYVTQLLSHRHAIGRRSSRAGRRIRDAPSPRAIGRGVRWCWRCWPPW